MITQLPIFPRTKTPINSILSTVYKDGIVKYFHLKKLSYSHSSNEYIKFRYITSSYVLLGFCKKVEIARCFGVSPDSVRYYANKLRRRGESGFFKPKPIKLTKKIEEFARKEFCRIYPINNCHFNSAIRKIIKDKFNTELSHETLRPIFIEEKQNINVENYETIPNESEFVVVLDNADNNSDLKKADDEVATRDKSDRRRVPNVLGKAKSMKLGFAKKVYI